MVGGAGGILGFMEFEEDLQEYVGIVLGVPIPKKRGN